MVGLGSDPAKDTEQSQKWAGGKLAAMGQRKFPLLFPSCWQTGAGGKQRYRISILKHGNEERGSLQLEKTRVVPYCLLSPCYFLRDL